MSRALQKSNEHALWPHVAGNDALDQSGDTGLAPSTQVLTLDGAIPVEFLNPGDRVITRHGTRILRSIARCILPEGAERVRLATDALGGKPKNEVVLMPGQRVLIRDWRAKTLWGTQSASVPVSRLVDGTTIRRETGGRQMMLSLYFGVPQIFYADGLEVASADVVQVPA